jgi:hypothetical protein
MRDEVVRIALLNTTTLRELSPSTDEIANELRTEQGYSNGQLKLCSIMATFA